MDRTLRLLFLVFILIISGSRREEDPAPEALLVTLIPAPSSAQDPVVKDNSSDVPSGLNPNPWRWNWPPSWGKETDGNWGLEAIRVPQLWNLNDYVRRTAHWQKFFVGILDAGFEDRDNDGRDDHPDLKNLRTVMLGDDGKPKPGAAAGNDSPKRFGYPTEIHAQWASPLNWAALAPDLEIDGTLFPRAENILVIESFDAILPGEHNHRKSDFSNVGGHFSAPGGRILSTVLKEKYDTLDGTSMAAPHVTGLISYLLAFDPSLTISEIKELLRRSAHAIEPESAGGRGPNDESPAPRIDAFGALIALDALRSGQLVQRALVDVDDCTHDGNLRADAQGREIEALCPDGLRGDGNIDMRDFRAFRDALLYTEGKLNNLDGSSRHRKKDLNGDGCVHDATACPIPENIYARFDFNGDGIVSRATKAAFNGSLLTDLEVLMGVWGIGPSAETEGWRAQDLIALLDSADVHIDLSVFGGSDRITVTAYDLPKRTLSTSQRWLTVTVPAGRALQLQLEGQGERHCVSLSPLEPGQDLWSVPTSC